MLRVNKTNRRLQPQEDTGLSGGEATRPLECVLLPLLLPLLLLLSFCVL
jgi:hypothetical protein